MTLDGLIFEFLETLHCTVWIALINLYLAILAKLACTYGRMEIGHFPCQ